MNKTKMKVMFTFLLVVVLLGASISFASTKDVRPSSVDLMRFTNIISFTCSIDVTSSGTANCYSSIRASSADKVKIVMYLQQNVSGTWKSIKSWSRTDPGTSMYLDGSYSVNTSNSFRVKSYGYVYVGTSIVESVTSICY